MSVWHLNRPGGGLWHPNTPGGGLWHLNRRNYIPGGGVWQLQSAAPGADCGADVGVPPVLRQRPDAPGRPDE